MYLGGMQDMGHFAGTADGCSLSRSTLSDELRLLPRHPGLLGN